MRKYFWYIVLCIAAGIILLIWALSQQQVQPMSIAAVKPTEQYQPVATPSIAMTDILNNLEFKEGMQQAVRDNDQELMQDLQDKAIEIATVAGFSPAQMKLLEGEQGKNYLSFNAKRQLFMQAFSLAFKQLNDIAPLKKRYPEAQDLFARADELVAQRDADLIKTAKELAGNDSDYQGYLEQARQQWRQAAHDIELQERVSK
jgi:hypothetical protein